MEIRKDNLSAAAVCRFCLTGDSQLTNLYDKNNQKKSQKNPNLLSKILASISVECYPSDKMPMFICDRCIFFMDTVYKFKNICREADNALSQFVHVGSPLDPIKWHPALVKLFNTVQKPVKVKTEPVEVLKIEGGPTVQVSQDGSDTGDEDEDVYNVRIGDGTEGGTSACVKVVTKEEPAKGKKKTENGLSVSNYVKEEEMEGVEIDSADDGKEEEPLALEEPNVRPKVIQGSYGCDECNNSYPLQQLLELHKMQKHRPRNAICPICDRKFFSRSDLTTHVMLRHEQADLQFQCVACDKNFKRDGLLRRHERAMHPELLQYKCPECPASFIEEEDIVAHRDRCHHSKRGNKHLCNICNKLFCDKFTLTRHQQVIHSLENSVACEYCPERFNSMSKLTRHVRTHAGAKAYPCKFCSKRFTKSHHCARHMRLKHSELVNTDEYRCEQCTATFANHDDFIYHSACHATVNCICPLCQEKFPDVDAVTAHIKTHVASNEYSCDYCELVFTSNEKLDAHVMAAHGDEIAGSNGSQEEEEFMEMEGDEDDEIEVKEEAEEMIVEIKKPDSFMKNSQAAEGKNNYTNSEELPAAVAAAPALVAKPLPRPPTLTPAPTLSTLPSSPAASAANLLHSPRDITISNIVQKAEEVKRKAIQVSETVLEKKSDRPKVETDKSLRLLEKELQELQRTNKREEPPKTPTKNMETLRNRRAQIHTSTPKPRSTEEKKTPVQTKNTQAEKKTTAEKRGVKENKRPEETRQAKTCNASVEEDKEAKSTEEQDTKAKEDSKIKEDKEIKKEEKESKNNVSKEEIKDKSVVKNGAAVKTPEEGVRRSSRANKVRDYAKMVQNKVSDAAASDDDSDDSDDEEYVGVEGRQRKRGGQKPTPKAAPVAKVASPAAAATAAAATTPARKRGRPRKYAVDPDVPTKVKKAEVKDDSTNNTATSKANTSQEEKMEVDDSTSKENQLSQQPEEVKQPDKEAENTEETNESVTPKPSNETKSTSPTSTPTAALKQVPMKALPPGVRPLPLPTGARPLGASEISEMQIGKKVVKVQKIVMTKAEVEAMAKKGLLEMKDGTMVLKAGVKLPDSSFKSMLPENASKESPTKAAPPPPAPTRCDLDA